MPPDDMPEFGKPEEIPLVVPDLTPLKRRCESTKKDGVTPCAVPPLKAEKYCLGHAKKLIPGMKQKWSGLRGLGRNVSKTQRTIRRTVSHYTKEELLALLSGRLDLVKERFGAMTNPEVEDMICNLVRTMAAVYKIEQAESLTETPGFRMRGAV